MNNDWISRSDLKKAIETYDKFACLPNGELEPFRNLEHPEMFEPYVHLRDIIKAIDGMSTVTFDNGIPYETTISYLHQDSITKSDTQLTGIYGYEGGRQ